MCQNYIAILFDIKHPADIVSLSTSVNEVGNNLKKLPREFAARAADWGGPVGAVTEANATLTLTQKQIRTC